MFEEKSSYSIAETQSELFAGLMMIFLFVAISFMLETKSKNDDIVKQQQTIYKITNDWAGTRQSIYRDLYQEFKNDLPVWNATLETDLTIRFNEPDMLFDNGSSFLKNQFKLILDDFWPRYIKVLKKYNKNLSEIKIEGHTSSIWSKHSTKSQSYYKNMKLSQERTIETLAYCMLVTPEYENFIIEKVTANGKSFSKMIKDKNGKISEKLSRRVEFSINTNDKEIIDAINSL